MGVDFPLLFRPSLCADAASLIVNAIFDYAVQEQSSLSDGKDVASSIHLFSKQGVPREAIELCLEVEDLPPEPLELSAFRESPSPHEQTTERHG